MKFLFVVFSVYLIQSAIADESAEESGEEIAPFRSAIPIVYSAASSPNIYSNFYPENPSSFGYDPFVTTYSGVRRNIRTQGTRRTSPLRNSVHRTTNQITPIVPPATTNNPDRVLVQIPTPNNHGYPQQHLVGVAQPGIQVIPIDLSKPAGAQASIVRVQTPSAQPAVSPQIAATVAAVQPTGPFQVAVPIPNNHGYPQTVNVGVANPGITIIPLNPAGSGTLRQTYPVQNYQLAAIPVQRYVLASNTAPVSQVHIPVAPQVSSPTFYSAKNEVDDDDGVESYLL